MDFINKMFRGDRVIWMIYLFLCLISIVEVYSATSTIAYKNNYWDPIVRHTVYLLFGTVFVLLTHAVKPRYFSILALALPIVWVLLIATKFLGQSINGADRWIAFGPISFQPSEAAKLCLIATCAFFLAKMNEANAEKMFRYIMIATGITCGIILIDNFSTALLLFGIIFILMFIGQIPKKYLGKLILIGSVSGSVFIISLFSLPENIINNILPRATTWKARIVEFFNKEELPGDPKLFKMDDDIYQASHAKIAIAEGRIIGKMPGNSQQRDFLPQAYSDFIFVIIIEELGLIGGILVLLLYVILFVRSGIIAGRCEKLFPKLLVMGCALMIVLQAFANMAVAVGLIPVTGQPLPLISRGGTSTIITCIYLGIILSVSRFENIRGIAREKEIEAEADAEAIAAKNDAENFPENFITQI